MSETSRPSLRDRLSRRAASLKRETHALVLACADPRTPLLAKVVAVLTVAYALSPVDLIPDPIPVLGYLDDLLIVPAGIALARALIPRQVMADARNRAADEEMEARLGRWGALMVGGAWVAGALVCAAFVWRLLRR